MIPHLGPPFPERLQPFLEQTKVWIDTLKEQWGANSVLSIISVVVLIALIISIKLLINLLGSGQSTGAPSSRTLRREARKNRRQGFYERAGELYEMVGDYGEAVEMYRKGAAYCDLGHVYELMKDWPAAAGAYEAGQDFDKANQLYERSGQYSKAAEVLIAAKKEASAAAMYEKGGNYGEAARLYEQSGYIQNAATCYEQTQDYLKAAELYERYFQEERVRSIVPSGLNKAPKKSKIDSFARISGRLYQKAGDPARAARIFADSGYNQEAAEAYIAANNLPKAAELFVESKDFIKASNLYKKIGQTEKSFKVLADGYVDENKFLEAAQLYERANDYIEAGDLYEKADQLHKAAEMFRKGGDLLRANEIFQTLGDPHSSAEILEESKQYREAAQQYLKVNQFDKAAQMFEEAGDFYEAGMIFNKLGRVEDTIAFLQKVDTQSDHYYEASLLLGRIFMKRGMLDTAKERYKKLISRKEISSDNIEPFYNIALIYEKHREYSNAHVLYEKIISENYQYKDVQNRINAVKEIIRKEKLQSDQGKPGASGQPSGRYRIMTKIGQGGMGVVFQAEDSLLNRIVAYKVLPPSLRDNPATLENFLREARVAAGINHTNIVTVFDTGTEGSEHYIVMEFVDGVSIKQILERVTTMPIKDILEIAIQVCRGLEHAHSKNVIHRDIKPANIMIRRDKVVKIMDFGLAKVLNAASQEGTTVKGTPLYMSPEQIQGKRIDHRTDIYSLGCSLYRMAAGRPPFLDGDVYYHHIHTPPVHPITLNPKIPPILNQIILKCIEKDPSRRYQTAMEIRSHIESAA